MLGPMEWMIYGESSFNSASLFIVSIFKCKLVCLISVHFTSLKQHCRTLGGEVTFFKKKNVFPLHNFSCNVANNMIKKTLLLLKNTINRHAVISDSNVRGQCGAALFFVERVLSFNPPPSTIWDDVNK